VLLRYLFCLFVYLSMYLFYIKWKGIMTSSSSVCVPPTLFSLSLFLSLSLSLSLPPSLLLPSLSLSLSLALVIENVSEETLKVWGCISDQMAQQTPDKLFPHVHRQRMKRHTKHS